jgi:hypothetical protein
MSNSHPITTASSSSNFQLIFNNALKAYEKRTKKDLLAHPLAAELQDCNSPTKILDVLHKQVQGPDQSLSGDDRWTKWLDPTVNVLYMLSETLGEGISLVSPKTRTHLRSAVSSLLGRYSHLERWYLPELGFSFQYESFLMTCAGYLNTNCVSLRQQVIFGKRTKH